MCRWSRALREVIVLGLEESGYRVDAVIPGDDAIDQLKWYDHDVAIIDWRMPGAEGSSAAHAAWINRSSSVPTWRSTRGRATARA